MKRLYLSTIETMATAIDAKDQVTHGHIRRVQQFALALAREVGVPRPTHNSRRLKPLRCSMTLESLAFQSTS